MAMLVACPPCGRASESRPIPRRDLATGAGGPACRRPPSLRPLPGGIGMVRMGSAGAAIAGFWGHRGGIPVEGSIVPSG